MSVTDLPAVERLPGSLPKEFSAVSVLVNNAGLALGVTTVDKNSLSDAQQVINTNVTSIVAMCTAFTPGMIERGEGHIINMGSIAGHYAYTTGTGGLFVYNVCGRL
jgi:3-hydroxy acid dehydrogenase/malonic semialdehyde reductase